MAESCGSRVDDSKLEHLRPPRKRKCFREFFVNDGHQPESSSSESKSIDLHVPNHKDSIPSDGSYLAKLLYKSPQTPNNYHDDIRSGRNALVVSNANNYLTKNVAWESFLHEIYERNNSARSSTTLLNLYTSPSEDPMKYLHMKASKTRSRSGNEHDETSNSQNSLSPVIHGCEELHGTPEVTVKAKRSDTGYSCNVSSQEWTDQSKNNKWCPARARTPAHNLSSSDEDETQGEDTPVTGYDSIANALDLSVPKLRNYVHLGTNGEQKNGNSDYTLEMTMEKQISNTYGKMNDGTLWDKATCREALEKKHQQWTGLSEQHSKLSALEEKIVGYHRCKQNDKPPHCSATCSCPNGYDCADSCQCDNIDNPNHCTCPCKTKGTSDKVKMTLTNFLRNSAKMNDHIIPQNTRTVHTEAIEETAGEVSLASMAEYFIEVALRKADKEKDRLKKDQ